MPDQRVGRVRDAHGRVPGERGRADGDVRDLLQGQQPSRQVPGADHRAGQDQGGQFLAVPLGVAGRDQSAHGVAHQDQRQAGTRGAGRVRHRVHVRDHVLEVLDHHPLPGRPAVAGVVRRVHGGAVPGEPGGEFRVPAGVLAVPVHQECQVAGGRVRPLPYGEGSVRAFEDVLADVGHLSSSSLGEGHGDLPSGVVGGL